LSLVSVGEIDMKRETLIENFLNTRQLGILNMPMILPDIFEFMAVCDNDPLTDMQSTLWQFL